MSGRLYYSGRARRRLLGVTVEHDADWGGVYVATARMAGDVAISRRGETSRRAVRRLLSELKSQRRLAAIYADRPAVLS